MPCRTAVGRDATSNLLSSAPETGRSSFASRKLPDAIECSRPTADIRPCGSSKTGFRLEPSSNNPTTSPSRPSASPQFAAAAAVALPAEQGRSTLVLGPLPHGPLTPSRVWHTRYALADAVVPSRAAYSQHPAQQLLDLRVVRSTPPQARNESIERTVPIGVQKQLVDLLPQWSG